MCGTALQLHTHQCHRAWRVLGLGSLHACMHAGKKVTVGLLDAVSCTALWWPHVSTYDCCVAAGAAPGSLAALLA